MANDQFFTEKRPFTKRIKEDSSSRSGSSRGGVSRGRGGTRGSSSSRGSTRGSTRGSRGGRGAKSNGSERKLKLDEELDEPEGDFDSDSVMSEGEEEEDIETESEDENETPAQKRLRLSQMYLRSLEKEVRPDDGGFDAADLDRDLIAERLQQDVLEHTGKLHLNLADLVQLPIPESSIYYTPSNGHRGPVTAAVASEDGSWLYTSSKDGSLIKWDLRNITSSSSTSTPKPRIAKLVYYSKKPSESSKRKLNSDLGTLEKGKGKSKEVEVGGHSDEILSLALSFDGTVLASGGKDKVIGVWNVAGEGIKWTRGLTGHKDKVGSITFRKGTHQLYSSSFDRTIKLFDLSTLSYVETLFGHQDCIQTVSSLRAEVCVSAGGRDKTIRFWKVTEESQLVFRGGVASRIRNVLDGGMEEDGIEEDDLSNKKRKRGERGEVKFVEGSVDCVAMVDDTTFLSGGDSGSICLWTITKKKPISTTILAHGINEYQSESEGLIGTARWITALACVGYGDIFASGSWDGVIRLWKIDERIRNFSPLTQILAPGYINSLQLICPSLRSSEPQSQRNPSSTDQKSLVVIAGIGKEPRLGRWMRMKGGKDCGLVVVIGLNDESTREVREVTRRSN